MKLLSGLICALAIWAAPAMAQSGQTGKVTWIQGPDAGRPCMFFQVGGIPYWYAFYQSTTVGNWNKDILLMAWATGQSLAFVPTSNTACGARESAGLQLYKQ